MPTTTLSQFMNSRAPALVASTMGGDAPVALSDMMNLGAYTSGTAPQNISAPEITGSPAEGETLTVSTPGVWDGDPTPTITYQWMRDLDPIEGETTTSYVLVAEDVDAMVWVDEIATNTFGSASIGSNQIGPIAA